MATKQKRRIVHIGNIYAACSIKLSAGLRDDLSVARYKQLGVRERFKGEKPYRVCRRCIRVVSNPLWFVAQRKRLEAAR